MPHALVAVETRHTKGGSIFGGATLIPSSEPATRRLHERRVNSTMCEKMALRLTNNAVQAPLRLAIRLGGLDKDGTRSGRLPWVSREHLCK